MFNKELIEKLLTQGQLGFDISDELVKDAIKQKQKGAKPNSLFDVLTSMVSDLEMVIGGESPTSTQPKEKAKAKETANENEDESVITDCGFGFGDTENEPQFGSDCASSVFANLFETEAETGMNPVENLCDFIGDCDCDSDVVFVLEEEQEDEELVMNFDKLTVEDLKFMLETLPLSHVDVIDKQLLAYMYVSQEEMENKDQAELAKLRNKMLTVYTSHLMDVNEPLYLNVGKMTVTDFLTSILVVPPNMCDELAEQMLGYLGETALALTLTTELLDLSQIQEILGLDEEEEAEKEFELEMDVEDEVDAKELAKEEKLAKENLAKAIKLYVSLYK